MINIINHARLKSKNQNDINIEIKIVQNITSRVELNNEQQ